MRTVDCTSKNIVSVLRTYATWLANEGGTSRKIAAESLNKHLNDLRDADFFGTENQCDPRNTDTYGCGDR